MEKLVISWLGDELLWISRRYIPISGNFLWRNWFSLKLSIILYTWCIRPAETFWPDTFFGKAFPVKCQLKSRCLWSPLVFVHGSWQTYNLSTCLSIPYSSICSIIFLFVLCITVFPLFFLGMYFSAVLHIDLPSYFSWFWFSFCIGGGGGGGYNHTSCHPMLSFIQAEHCSDSVPREKQTLLILKTVFSKSLVCSPNIWWSMHRKMENKRQWQTGVADEGDEGEKIN